MTGQELIKLIFKLITGPGIAAPIFIATGFIKFAPWEWIEDLDYGLRNFKYDSHFYTILFIFSGAATIWHLGTWIYSILIPIYRNHKKESENINKLKQLSSDEKRTLSYYIVNNTKSQEYEIFDGITNSLLNSNIIYNPPIYSRESASREFNIQEWAWKYLKDHTNLLEPEYSEIIEELTDDNR